jgi:hypothetical protein
MVPRVGRGSGVAHCGLGLLEPELVALGSGWGAEVGLGGLRGDVRTGQLAGVNGSVEREASRAVRRQRWQRAWPHWAGRVVGCGLER